MRRGDFYEDDEPVSDVLKAFERGEQCVTSRPVRGWTYFLTPDMTLRELSTYGAPITVTPALRDGGK